MTARLSMIVLLGAAACRPPPRPAPFKLLVAASSDEGIPFEGLPVLIEGKSVGRTDGEGELSVDLPGERDGTRVAVEVQPPDGFKPIRASGTILVGRIVRTTNNGTLAVPLEFRALFGSKVRHYALLVDVGTPGLPIHVFGVERARTNGAGVALMLLPGTPGDTLEVRVSAAGKKLLPAHLDGSYKLEDHADAFVLKGKFTAPYVAPKKKSPPRVPMRL
jgi:hypothetical protein